ncbi:MAG: hypothetical protein M3O22_04580 [Pseudomonadota bacterium]|nr:hypothetical protein [Pseudomonadota bacterium]
MKTSVSLRIGLFILGNLAAVSIPNSCGDARERMAVRDADLARYRRQPVQRPVARVQSGPECLCSWPRGVSATVAPAAAPR